MKYYFIVAMAALFSIKLMAAPTIAPSPEQVSPLLNGLAIPDVTLYSADNKAVALRERVQQQPSVLVFYRGGWCPYCNAQLAALRTIEPELTKLGYQIIAITPDSVSSIVNSMNDTGGEKLTYQLLSDNQFKASSAFGLAYYLDDKTASIYKGKLGSLITTESGTEKVVLPVPAVYILNTDGEVVFNYVHINYKTRLESELLLKAAELALQ
ncbi:MAG: peroxiredoxin [Rheinheimera sp.]|uniref:peroxiredoxin-like family protein n=1 Tax=Arsukibacterium sp. UBA3155 TaxID=1946058 RepID=UPI000C89C801|nr:peroxiredoxin-like family protein [Arsukibacterium sp. UBA3155]MAD77337.1 peroxiredoxin [Rheinheimera sp.]|tara:strand:- start:22385 stop:23017 length:633 start_codon:yes stop_codon:yes gene_type:complete